MLRLRAAVLVIALAAPSLARANGESVLGPPTTFERFVLSACSPCVRESYPVASLAIAPPTLAGFPQGVARALSRPGEIVIEVLRAQQLGRRDWTSLALRVSLAVKGGQDGEMFRLGVGLLDAAEVRALVNAVGEMAAIAAAPPANARAESSDVDFHGGSLRVGVLRIRGDSVAYVQTGDLTLLMQRAVWEVPTTLYLGIRDLSGLAAALSQAMATLESVRGN